MMVAALLVIPVVILDETQRAGTLHTVATALNWVIWLAFAAELVVLLARAPRRGAWLWNNPLTVAIVLLTPPFLPGVLQALRIARVTRLLRVLRVVRLTRTARSIRVLTSSQAVAWAGLLTGLVVLGGGAAFVEAEHGQHLSLDDGIWWALTTVTTVGYGDVYPHTGVGRVIAAVVMLSGIGFVALLTAAAAHRFIVASDEVESIEVTILREMRELQRQVDALVEARTGP